MVRRPPVIVLNHATDEASPRMRCGGEEHRKRKGAEKRRHQGPPIGGRGCRTNTTRSKTGRARCPPWKRTLASLEFEFHAKPGIERTLVAGVGVSVDCGRASSDRLEEVGISGSDSALLVLVKTEERALVAHIEEIRNQAESLPFRDAHGVVDMTIDTAEVGRPAQGTASRRAVGSVVRAERNLTRIGVNRMRIEIVDRNTRLEVNRGSQCQSLGVVAAKRV